MASWMEASVTKVARVSAMFSQSLARPRFRPSQENAVHHPAAWREDEALRVVTSLCDRQAQQRLAQNCDGYFGRSADCRTAAARRYAALLPRLRSRRQRRSAGIAERGLTEW